MQAAAKFWSRLWLRLQAPGSAAFSVSWPPPGPAPPTSGSGPKLEARRSGGTLGSGGGGGGGGGRRQRRPSAARVPGQEREEIVGEARRERGRGESEGGADGRTKGRGRRRLSTARPRRPAYLGERSRDKGVRAPQSP